MKREKHRIVANKLRYSRGERPPVDCILCAVAGDDDRVERVVVYRHRNFYITLNLYPYNPGHLMVVPYRHIEDVRGLEAAELPELHALQTLAMNVLEAEYQPAGFNLGYNLGAASGASIPHLHLQIVPRYHSELGFFDIIGDSRVIVEEPRITQSRLAGCFARLAPGFFAEEEGA